MAQHAATRTATRTATRSGIDIDPLLAAARDAAHAEVVAAARKFELAAAWAERHPAPVLDEVVTPEGVVAMFGDQPITLAGEGAPGVSEFAVAELAAALGLTPYAGRALVGSAVECRHRLPRIWARVVAGEVPVWKVRRLTEQTHRLPMPGAAYVDRHLAPVLHACSYAQIERAVADAAAEDQDEQAELDRLEAAAEEHLTIELGSARLNHGRVPVHGLLDYPLAAALEAHLQAAAHDLLTDLPDLSLDQRRVLALGQLATSVTSGASGAGGAGGASASSGKHGGVAEVVVYTHHYPGEGHGIVGVEGTTGAGHLTVEQLTDWCRTIATKVSVRPVLDLDTEIHIDRYEPTPLQHEQAVLTTPTCVFPCCTRPARRCDLDHIVAYHAGGETTSWNLAPLCRLHHRMKTHGHWTYQRRTRTRFTWTSPSGEVYDVDHTHTRRRTR